MEFTDTARQDLFSSFVSVDKFSRSSAVLFWARIRHRAHKLETILSSRSTLFFRLFFFAPMICNQSCHFRTTHPMITSLMSDQWQRPPLASCHVLKFIGGYLALVFVSGIALNGFVLRSLLDKKRGRSPIRIFMIALAFADLMAALLGIPLPLTSNLACRYLKRIFLRNDIGLFLDGCTASICATTKVSLLISWAWLDCIY